MMNCAVADIVDEPRQPRVTDEAQRRSGCAQSWRWRVMPGLKKNWLDDVHPKSRRPPLAASRQ
jgi:hypothetical protein